MKRYRKRQKEGSRLLPGKRKKWELKGLNGKYSGSSVKTGDNSQIGWILLVTCVCLAGLAGVF